ncbi:MAG: isoprenyl transferase [Saprospiraceae bacterium]|uniref:Isoprenyl transferase n=1 Tax=Candidatus Opimibacter skivensis TaxID=2982028 RepID=A0A9D7SZN0_9BACT|nr:isoprenyl transferase [Candidatus Opimibacter skivensis]
MASAKEQINLSRLPQHVAVIMDGNGRWAKEHGKPRIWGHRNGVKSVREVTEAATEIGIQFLTLYAFSTENWNRPRPEVNALMDILVSTIREELATMNKNNIRLNAIGDLDRLPPRTKKALLEGIENTKTNDRMTLTLALNYSARWEITEAMRKVALQAAEGRIKPEDIDETSVSTFLATSGIPDPELLIRTSGERRISNFLLWQIAYTELYFSDVYWPDFEREDFYNAILDYQQRERRFGMISEQLTHQ